MLFLLNQKLVAELSWAEDAKESHVDKVSVERGVLPTLNPSQMALTNDSPWCNAFLTNRDWIPADLSVIRWDDCTMPSLWLELLYRTMFPAGGQYPLQMTSDVLREGLHGYWQQSNIPEPSGRELGSWFFENLVQCNATKKGLDTYIEKYALRNCEKEFCKRLPWQGNSDQAGRGVRLYPLQRIARS